MSRLLLSLTLTLAPTLSAAADWPQFLGPNRDGVTKEVIAPWTTAPKVAWKAKVGPSHASPVVANGIVYAFYETKGSDKEKADDTLAAFDAKTGERKWEKSIERQALPLPFGNGPRGTPAVVNGVVYTYGSTGLLAAWDAATGDVKWKTDALAEYKAKNLFFGVSTSPIVEDGKVVVMVGGKGHGIVAFDAATGKPAWQATDDSPSYSSPIVYGEGANRQLAFLTGDNLLGLSPAGKLLWKVPFKDALNESSTTPVKVGDVLIGSSVKAGSVALKLTGDKAEQVWKKPRLTCYFSTPVPVGEHLYMIHGEASLVSASSMLRCVETATGTVKWEKPKVGRYHAALVRTGDDKLLMHDDNGYLTLIQPDAKEYKELARSKVCGLTWAHPAVVGGRVYLRDEGELLAIELK